MLLLDIAIFAILLASAFVLERMGIVTQALHIKDATLKNIRVVADKRISDHWKEIFLRRNSIRTFMISMKLTLLIAVFLGMILVPLGLIELLFPKLHVFEYLLTWRGIIVSILPFIAYFFIRRYSRRK